MTLFTKSIGSMVVEHALGDAGLIVSSTVSEAKQSFGQPAWASNSKASTVTNSAASNLGGLSDACRTVLQDSRINQKAVLRTPELAVTVASYSGPA